jgi:urease gamma subunit
VFVADGRLMEALKWKSQKSFKTDPVMEAIREMLHE